MATPDTLTTDWVNHAIQHRRDPEVCDEPYYPGGHRRNSASFVLQGASSWSNVSREGGRVPD